MEKMHDVADDDSEDNRYHYLQRFHVFRCCCVVLI